MNKKNWYIDTENAYTKNKFSGQKKYRKGNSIHVYYVSFKLPWIFVFFPYFILLLAFILTLCAAILLLYQIPIFFYLHSFCYRLIQSSSRFSSTSSVLHWLTLNIHHRHDFLCGYPEYDFSSIALPIPWPWRLLFFLYNSCSSHAHGYILYWQFNSIFFSSFWSFLCTIDRRKKNIYCDIISFCFYSLFSDFFSRRHSSFVQPSILYYIEFSAIAFVLFNLKREQSRNMNVKKKFVRFFQSTKNWEQNWKKQKRKRHEIQLTQHTNDIEMS